MAKLDNHHETEQEIGDFFEPTHAYLIKTGLQALWRERNHAYQVACSIAAQRDKEPPSEEEFGLPDVSQAMRRWGIGASLTPW